MSLLAMPVQQIPVLSIWVPQHQRMSRSAILQDLRRLLLARDQLKIPLIIGSCGTSGVDSGVDWMREMTLEVAR